VRAGAARAGDAARGVATALEVLRRALARGHVPNVPFIASRLKRQRRTDARAPDGLRTTSRDVLAQGQKGTGEGQQPAAGGSTEAANPPAPGAAARPAAASKGPTVDEQGVPRTCIALHRKTLEVRRAGHGHARQRARAVLASARARRDSAQAPTLFWVFVRDTCLSRRGSGGPFWTRHARDRQKRSCRRPLHSSKRSTGASFETAVCKLQSMCAEGTGCLRW